MKFIRTCDPVRIGLVLVLLAPTARPLFKYLPQLEPLPFLLYAAGFMGLVEVLARSPQLRRRLARPATLCLALLVLALLSGWLYPLADGLKTQLRGSDQDDCVIHGVTLLAQFAHPYSQPSYFGNPCSPGLGMLVLYAPFVLTHTYPLAAIVASGLAIVAVSWQRGSPRASGVFALLLFASPFAIELLVVGSDLVVLGCGLVVLAYGLAGAVASRHRPVLLGLALLAGLLASTRVNFLVLPLLLAALIATRWRPGAALFLLVSVAVALLPSAVLYGLSPAQFTPLHLLDKSSTLLQGGLRELAIVTSAAGWFFGLRLTRSTPQAIPMAMLLALAPALVALSVADLVVIRSGNLASWEGANYLFPLLPLSASLLALRISPP